MTVNSYLRDMLTAAQMRAGRGLLGWSQRDLASHSGLPLSTIKNIERGASDPRASTLAAIEKALGDVLRHLEARQPGPDVLLRSCTLNGSIEPPTLGRGRDLV